MKRSDPNPEPAAHVSQLWRYPVKSMTGERLPSASIGPRGVHADRLWAVRDLEQEMTGTARRLGALMTCSARYADEPGPDAGPGNAPEVVITFPDGYECSSADPTIDDRLSNLLGRRVRLTSLPLAEETRENRAPRWTAAEIRRDLGIAKGEPMPDTSYLSLKQLASLARWTTPPGTYFDFFPIHLLSVASLETMAAEAPGSEFDPRRFRPNVLLDTPLVGQPEREWCGDRLEAPGSAFRVEVPTVRCVVPTRSQPGLPRDPQIMRTVAALADRHLGVYATVERSGELREGDPLLLIEADDGRLHRLSRSGATRAKRLLARGVTRISR